MYVGNIKYCMKYDTCKRCPQNKICEKEFRKEEKQKQKPQKTGE